MNQPQPTIRSGLKIPFLDGSNDHLVFSREHWNQIIAVANSVMASPSWVVTNHGIILDMAGGGGFNWQKPNKELDWRVAVPKDTFVYVSPMSGLVTAGMKDLISGSLVNACDGIWQANVDVPAMVTVGGVNLYNVPVFPYIAGATAIGGTPFLPGTTAPTGTPLIGDLDLVDTGTGNPTIFWIYWGQVAAT